MCYFQTYLLFLFSIFHLLFISGSADAAEKNAEKENSTPTVKWVLPWKQDTTYKYTWHLNNKNTGTSEFKLGFDKKKGTISCSGKISLSSDGSDLEGLFLSTYDKKLNPVSFSSGFSGKIGKYKGGDSGVIVLFEKDAIKLRIGSLKGDVITIPKPKNRFYLSGGHAIHHWALFTPFINTTKKSKIQAFMPKIRQFLDVSFTPDGKESTRGIEATRMKFNVRSVKTGQSLFFGTIWIAPDGRLLRYRQPNASGELNVWISRESLKK